VRCLLRGQTSSKNNIYKKNTTEHDAEARDHMITLPPFGVFTSCLKLNANAIQFENFYIYIYIYIYMTDKCLTRLLYTLDIRSFRTADKFY